MRKRQRKKNEKIKHGNGSTWRIASREDGAVKLTGKPYSPLNYLPWFPEGTTFHYYSPSTAVVEHGVRSEFFISDKSSAGVQLQNENALRNYSALASDIFPIGYTDAKN